MEKLWRRKVLVRRIIGAEEGEWEGARRAETESGGERGFPDLGVFQKL
jgi:hypothetical protein